MSTVDLQRALERVKNIGPAQPASGIDVIKLLQSGKRLLISMASRLGYRGYERGVDDCQILLIDSVRKLSLIEMGEVILRLVNLNPKAKACKNIIVVITAGAITFYIVKNVWVQIQTKKNSSHSFKGSDS